MEYNEKMDSWLVKLANQLINLPDIKEEDKNALGVFLRTSDYIIANVTAKAILNLQDEFDFKEGLLVIYMKYKEGKSDKDIAKDLGFTRNQFKINRKEILSKINSILNKSLYMIRDDVIKNIYRFAEMRLDDCKDDLINFSPNKAFGTRMVNSLLRYDKDITIDKLKEMNKEEILSIRNIGEKSYEVLYEFCKLY